MLSMVLGLGLRGQGVTASGLTQGQCAGGQEAIKLLPFLWDQGLNTHFSAGKDLDHYIVIVATQQSPPSPRLSQGFSSLKMRECVVTRYKINMMACVCVCV